jgi:hypothetical protein
VVNTYGFPFCEATAVNGKGVFETLRTIAKLVIEELNRKYSRPVPPPSAALAASAARVQPPQPASPVTPPMGPARGVPPQPSATIPATPHFNPAPAMPAAVARGSASAREVQTEVAVLEHEVNLDKKDFPAAPAVARKPLPVAQPAAEAAQSEEVDMTPAAAQPDPELDDFEQAILDQKKKS